MNFSDNERLTRLTEVVDRNYRLTHLYAQYLERFPDAITPEAIRILTDEGGLTPEEALVGLLSELFGLNFEDKEDRILIRDYLTPSVRLLDAEKYRNNPYYKTVKIENTVDGSWELKREAYLPYRGVIAGDIELYDGGREVPPLGFFTEKFEFPAVLEDGNEWMTLTPVDLDTCTQAIEEARGKVVTFGLGLGYYAFMCSEKEEVSSVTVVEKSENVIRLFKKHILPQFPHGEKIRIIEADAFEYAERIMPDEGFDLAFVDTWRDASDGAPMYKRMKPLEKLSPRTKFLYWIEGFIRSRLRAFKFERLLSSVKENTDGAPSSFKEFLEKLENIP